MIIPKTLKVRNWERWQTYRKDRGQPSWVKIYRRLLSNPEWVSLTDSQRGQLVAIWLLAADQGGVIPASPTILRKLCHMDDEPDINLLISAGFLEVVTTCQPPDNQVVTTCPQNDAPEEKRIEKKREDIPDCSNPVRSGKVYVYENGKIKLNEADYNRWKQAFSNLNLMAEIESMAEWAANQPNWFMALSAALAKKDAAAHDRTVRIRAEVAAGAKKVVTGGGFA